MQYGRRTSAVALTMGVAPDDFLSRGKSYLSQRVNCTTAVAKCSNNFGTVRGLTCVTLHISVTALPHAEVGNLPQGRQQCSITASSRGV